LSDEVRTYHWELKNYSLINHDTDAYITFDLTMCRGEADLDINLGDMLSHQYLPTYNVSSIGAGTTSMLRAKLRYGEFYASVKARGNVTYTFTVSAAVSNTTNGPSIEIMHSHANYSKDATRASLVPSPGAGGEVTVSQIGSTTVLACWVSTPQDNVTYDVYYHKVSNPQVSTDSSGVKTCNAECCTNPGSCGMLSPCGLIANEAINQATKAATLRPGDSHDAGGVVGPSAVLCKRVAGLSRSATYVFNVAATRQHGLATAYSGVSATLKYTIIAAAHDEMIIVYVLIGIAVVFLLLITCIVCGKILMEVHIRRQKKKKIAIQLKKDAKDAQDKELADLDAKGGSDGIETVVTENALADAVGAVVTSNSEAAVTTFGDGEEKETSGKNRATNEPPSGARAE
jgi:hypothetical protein